MSRSLLFTALLIFCNRALTWADPGPSQPQVPVLLELFTSEGCSSCPPADRLLAEFDQKQPVPGVDLIVLSEHVDYWDNLGWKDPASSGQYTGRQQQYTTKLDLEAYTPQLVVDGRFGFVGSDRKEALRAIRKAVQEPKSRIELSDAVREHDFVTARIELKPANEKAGNRRGRLLVALAENRVNSSVIRGENAGKSLVHVAVTRVLADEGVVMFGTAWTKDIVLRVPPGAGANGLRVVAFVQDLTSGSILAVAEGRL